MFFLRSKFGYRNLIDNVFQSIGSDINITNLLSIKVGVYLLKSICFK